MQDETRSLIAEAEESVGKRAFTEAGRYYERAAATAGAGKEAAELLRKAGEAHAEMLSTGDASRCYRGAGQLLDAEDKAECLIDCWRVYIRAIVAYEYECSYEWRGATDGRHDSDSAIYKDLIMETRREAEEVLRQAVNIEGVDGYAIIEQARDECRRCQREGGWGASMCQGIVAEIASEMR